MKVLRIGILDEEERYVERLCAYLNRQGIGRAAGFTQKQALVSYLGKRRLDLLAGTEREELVTLGQQYPQLSLVWLTGSNSESQNGGIYPLFRYQSAEIVGKRLGELAGQLGLAHKREKPMIAVYSPVGRCGKTSLALRVIETEAYGEWLYVGLEDYSFFTEEADAFFYYVKEREENRVLEWMAQCGGKICSAGSPFDTRQMNQEDLKWLHLVLNKSQSYRGAIWDIGTGALSDPEFFLVFDALLVPYLAEEKALAKRSRFERLLQLHGLDDVLEQIRFVDMGRQEDITDKLEELFLPRSETG